MDLNMSNKINLHTVHPYLILTKYNSSVLLKPVIREDHSKD